MIVEEILEASDARGPPLPDGQRATVYLEITPILSRNNKPNPLGATIPCISLLKRLHEAGYEAPPYLEPKASDLMIEVRNGVTARLMHECRTGGKVIIQASSDCKSMMRACEQIAKQGHSLHVLYTDTHQYVGVPEHMDEDLSEQVARGLMSASRLVAYAQTFDIQMAERVLYPNICFYGNNTPSWRWSFGTAPVLVADMPPWVKLFNEVAAGNPKRWLITEVVPMITVID